MGTSGARRTVRQDFQTAGLSPESWGVRPRKASHETDTACPEADGADSEIGVARDLGIEAGVCGAESAAVV